MTYCCDFPALSNPYTSGQEAHRVWETVDRRRYVIANCSALLCPITCTVRTLGCLICCGTAECIETRSSRRFEPLACLPPYKDKCTLLCCAVLYPFHACPRNVPDLYPFTYSRGFLLEPQALKDTYVVAPGQLVVGKGGGLRHEHYATGPERQIMSQGERVETAEARRRMQDFEAQQKQRREAAAAQARREQEAAAAKAKRDAVVAALLQKATEEGRQKAEAARAKYVQEAREQWNAQSEKEREISSELDRINPAAATAFRMSGLLTKQNRLLVVLRQKTAREVEDDEEALLELGRTNPTQAAEWVEKLVIENQNQLNALAGDNESATLLELDRTNPTQNAKWIEEMVMKNQNRLLAHLAQTP